MRTTFFIICFIILLNSGGCSYLKDQDKKADELASQRIDTINWNEVDSFPLFESCNELAPKEEQKVCFESTFSRHLMSALGEHEFVVNYSIRETVLLDLKIDHQGAVSILNIRASENLKRQLPQLEAALEKAIRKLPKIYAAQKKAKSEFEIQMVPVSTRFTLPIELDVK
ncbi:hypothetical protein GWK08_05000 [Leptobacterium flavescens]|uniref:TonB C-terminal domain-containing protein n=1 Tax=Leptobacterium flavescens TaxID=472055 RepID=A0A6P0UQV0_9FLAO|nr:hypothetical protein [Leptobacterium flavescens]NER12786.1 hypothetical protein [Leptobacterium flavescens]